MPDFSAVFSQGTTLVAWTDPPDAFRPSRLNPIIGHGHQRRVGTIGVSVSVLATVGGVSGPLDSALGGRLFLGMFAESPGSPPAMNPVPGQSSLQRFRPAEGGHYTFVMRRDGGGAIFFHLDVPDLGGGAG